MAVGTLLATAASAAAPYIGQVAGSAASAGIGSLLAGNGPDAVTRSQHFLKNSPTLNGGALTVNPFKNSKTDFGYNIGLGNDLRGALDQFKSLSNAGADQLGRLQGRLQPGFSDLRQAGLDRIGANRSRTVGDLRNDLARRRVLGSSFGNDTIARAEAEFALQEADFASRTLLQEIDATVNLINQQNDLRLNAIGQELAAQTDLANLSASLVTGLTNSMTALAQTNAAIAAETAAGNAQGLGAFFQPAIDQVGSGVSDWITNILGGGGTD